MNDTTNERQSPFLLIAIIIGAVVINFVPQVRDYLLTRWMLVGLGGAVFLSLMLLEDRAQHRLDSLSRFHWILLIIYLVHQFEEFGIDLLGRENFFLTYFQTVIDNVGGAGAASGFKLTPLASYRTDTLIIWLMFLTAVWGHRRFIWPGLVAAGIVLTNGIFHIGIALWLKEYQPGLGSAVVLFLPVSLLYLRFVWRHCDVGWQGIVGVVLFGLIPKNGV